MRFISFHDFVGFFSLPTLVFTTCICVAFDNYCHALGSTYVIFELNLKCTCISPWNPLHLSNRKAKHLDATTMCTYSHANTPLSQSKRAYYLSYFINRVICLFGFCLFRPVKEICGFSRETVVAVTTNIESMEFRRCQNNDIGYEEHPRAGSTDDVEAVIAFFHRILGVVFTLKQFKSGWRNIVRCVHRCQSLFFQ